jgi:hypothetical protein
MLRMKMSTVVDDDGRRTGARIVAHGKFEVGIATGGYSVTVASLIVGVLELCCNKF